MKGKLLVVGFASLSLFAAAQSQSNAKQDAPKTSNELKSPRDAASGQASGRAASSDSKGVIHRDIAARDSATGQATGKTMAADDWNQQNSAATKPQVQNVSATDSNADRNKATYDVKSLKGARLASPDAPDAASSDVKSPRDSSTGMATGKRQHKPLPTAKSSDQTPNK